MQAARGASLSSSDTTSTPSGPSDRRGARRGALVVFASIAVVGYLTDLVSKILAVEHLTGKAPVPVLGDWLTLYLARNPGAAFSTGTSYTLVLTFVAAAAGVAVLWTVRRVRSTGWAIGLGFLMAGVLGNLTDRIFRSPGALRGHVVDFLQLPNWPIFNVADVCINIAAGVVILQAVRGISVNGNRSRDTAESTGESPDDPTPAS